MSKNTPTNLVSFVLLFLAHLSAQQSKAITNVSEFNQAVKVPQPESDIVLANGNWENVELLFEGK